MSVSAPRPVALVAELTHACPLSCPYCSNPLELVPRGQELDVDAWARVFAEAARLGVLQVLLTGGEPLVRRDLEQLVAAARSTELYTTLITGGVPLGPDRVRALARAGLDAVQLSFQAANAHGDAIAGLRVHARKLEAAAWIRECGLPLTVNVVLHRGNVEEVPALVALAERLGADRLELATVQYLGFGRANRAALRPPPESLARAHAEAIAEARRLAGRMEIVVVAPDEPTSTPAPCMEGWARRTVVVAPDGVALPCHHARSLPLRFESVRDRPLASIWNESPAFGAFRGEAWMPAPCRTCDRRAIDRGGCRCRAFLETGDPAAGDPVCDRVAALRRPADGRHPTPTAAAPVALIRRGGFR